MAGVHIETKAQIHTSSPHHTTPHHRLGARYWGLDTVTTRHGALINGLLFIKRLAFDHSSLIGEHGGHSSWIIVSKFSHHYTSKAQNDAYCIEMKSLLYSTLLYSNLKGKGHTSSIRKPHISHLSSLIMKGGSVSIAQLLDRTVGRTMSICQFVNIC